MVQAVPEGVGNIVPYLCVRGAKKAVEFYKAAFGAQVMSMMPMGDLIGHADLKIGASRVYLADEMPEWGAVKSPSTLKGATANIHLWVDDCDAAFAQAVAAGAKVVMPLVDQFWGDRYGMVSDPFGHIWAISSHKEDLTPEELMSRGKEAMAQMAQATAASAKAKPKSKPRTGPKVKPATATPVAPKAAGGTAKAKLEPKAAKKAEKKAKSGKKDKSGKKSKKSKKSKKEKKRKKKSKR